MANSEFEDKFEEIWSEVILNHFFLLFETVLISSFVGWDNL